MFGDAQAKLTFKSSSTEGQIESDSLKPENEHRLPEQIEKRSNLSPVKKEAAPFLFNYKRIYFFLHLVQLQNTPIKICTRHFDSRLKPSPKL